MGSLPCVAFGFLACVLLRPAQAAEGPLAADDDDDRSRRAGEIVRGLTEAFLDQDATPQERYCLAGGAGKLAGGVIDMAFETASGLGDVFGRVRSVAHDFGMPIRAGPTPTPAWGSPYPTGLPGVWAEASPVMASGEAALTTVELARVTVIKLGTMLTSMFGFEHQLVKSCMTGQSAAAFGRARSNLANMSFVFRHLVANGVDVVDHLSEAVTAFDSQKYRAFGSEIGTAWRKVLLDDESSSPNLAVHLNHVFQSLRPEKLAKEWDVDDIERVTKGFVGSLFGPGASVQVSAAAPALPTRPREAGWTPTQPGPNGIMRFSFPQAANAIFGAATDEQLSVDVDIHSCVSENMELIGSAWAPVVGLAEQFFEGHCTGAVGTLCMSLWTVVLTDVQEALQTCGFNPQQQKVLLHSAWAGKLFHANLSMPEEPVRTKELTTTMASTLEAFRGEHWTQFGAGLGSLCSEAVVASFPQQWSIDESGRLREQFRDNVSGQTIGLLWAVPSMFLLLFVAVARGVFAALRGGEYHREMLVQFDREELEEGMLE